MEVLAMGDINPPHKGHKNVLESCVKQLKTKEEGVSIDFRISQKPLKYLLPWDVRKKLIDTLINGCDTLKDCVNILPKDKNLFEINLSKYNALLIGSDIAKKISMDFFKAKEKEFFDSFKKLIVVNRPGHEINENELNELRNGRKKEVVIIEGNVEMSSSEIRERYRNNTDNVDYFYKNIPTYVSKYIENNPKILEEFKIFFNEKK